MKSYLFYDLETSGLSVAFDQILQFAAIRTNEAFEEIERYELFFRLRSDVVPHPQALLVNQLAERNLWEGLPEYEGISKIHAWFTQAQTVSIGYNNLGFDDEFLRFAFYHNLLNPYLHQYANQCFRMDLFSIIIFIYLYIPDLLAWPAAKVGGYPSLKLEELIKANQLKISRHAHDALSDVEATVRLAQIVREQRPDFWRYWENMYCTKEQAWFAREPEGNVALLVGSEFGIQQHFQAIAFCLGRHRHYRNQTIWLPLNKPLTRQIPLVDCYPLHKKRGEAPFCLPDQPKYFRGDSVLREQVEDNLRLLRAEPEYVRALQDYYLEEKYPQIVDLELDAALYQRGFWSTQEEEELEQFKQGDPPQKIDFLPVISPALRPLAIRLLGRNYPELLKATRYQSNFEEYLSYVWSGENRRDYRGKLALTPQQALTFMETLPEEQRLKLKLLEDWLKQNIGKYVGEES